ncbi:MAG: endonuclease/exonuclease/phosphatase family protein [Nitrospirae bacterium]|nr:endonuclease/exonuclease/phosphatase family protein [Nitrospirota bacterium]
MSAGARFSFSRWAGLALAGLSLAALGLPLLGRWLWLADLFTHFVLQYAVVALCCALGFWLADRRRLAAWALAIFLVEAIRLVPLWSPSHAEAGPADPVRLTVLQFNVNYHNRAYARTLDWITRQNPDVVVLVEVTDEWRAALDALDERYGARLISPDRKGRGIAVLSRVPSSTLRLEWIDAPWSPTIVLTASPSPDSAPVTLYAAHLASPSTPSDAAARNRELADLGRRAAADPSRHTIIAGDLNVTRWSPWFEALTASTGLRDGQEGFGLQTTWPSPIGRWFGIAIDHTLVSSSIRVVSRTVGPDLGSDHYPVVTTVELPTRRSVAEPPHL